jgi:predicted transcriptional regulator
MSPEYRHVADTELKILQALWDLGSATTRQLADRLYPEGGVAQYYTVQKLLERLEEKECVARDRGARVHQFSATVGREELVGERLQELSDKICGGSLVPMLTELVRLRKLTADEYGVLKDLVKELDEKSRKRKPKSNEKGTP